MRPPNWLERVLVGIGCGCLTVCGIQILQAKSFQRAAGQTLAREIAAASELSKSTPPPEPVPAVGSRPTLDDRLVPTIPAIDDALIGQLEIPRLHLSVIVMEGDDAATLARAAGHVPGTALPWESGNAVVAGHRDTFFRPLEDLRDGDEIRMTTVHGTFDYHVSWTEVVTPDDVAVLAPTPVQSLTLVTCYPFVYVGPAPRRFIVHAR